jgi:hypothetical protein
MQVKLELESVTAERNTIAAKVEQLQAIVDSQSAQHGSEKVLSLF